jgi:hypothetical protein
MKQKPEIERELLLLNCCVRHQHREHNIVPHPGIMSEARKIAHTNGQPAIDEASTERTEKACLILQGQALSISGRARHARRQWPPPGL